MRLIAIDPARVNEFWPGVAHYIATALVNVGLTDVSTIKDRLTKGDALLWLACDDDRVLGAVVTQLVQSYGQRVCEIVAWGSDDHDRCFSLMHVLDNFARNEGCARIRIIGRKGWIRKLPGFGLKAVILEKVT